MIIKNKRHALQFSTDWGMSLTCQYPDTSHGYKLDAKILTSSLLSKLAFLNEEVTELASFSAIQALKSLTANEAAMPVERK